MLELQQAVTPAGAVGGAVVGQPAITDSTAAIGLIAATMR